MRNPYANFVEAYKDEVGTIQRESQRELLLAIQATAMEAYESGYRDGVKAIAGEEPDAE